jgi:hypothetical protein
MENLTAEMNAAAQKAVDRAIAARVELAAAIEGINAVRAEIADGSAAAVAFIDQYMNPTAANPEPIAPEVAAPEPAIEPPVFTTIEDADITLENSSGGASEVADEFSVDVPVIAETFAE